MPSDKDIVKPWFSTCDWGGCDEPTVGFRFDDNADELSKTTGYDWSGLRQTLRRRG